MLRVLSVLLMTCAVLVTCVNVYLYKPCNPSDGSEKGLCVDQDDCDSDDDTILGDHPPIPDEYPIACPSSLVCCKPRPDENTTPSVPAKAMLPRCGMLDRTAGDASAPGKKEARQVKWNVAFMVPLGLEDGRYKMMYVANGVLIHQQAVLTTGINVVKKIEVKRNGMEVYAVVGDYDQAEQASKRKALLVGETVVHKDFNPTKRTYNIAIAFLKSSAIVLAPTAVPACLPPQGHQVAQGTRCFFTGWGNSSYKDPYILIMTEVPKLDAENCTARLRGPGPLGFGTQYKLPHTLTCAGGEAETDLCTGTGGSPLVCPLQNNPDQYTLVGLRAYVRCGKISQPGVFTDVSNFRNWIEEQLTKRNLTYDNAK